MQRMNVYSNKCSVWRWVVCREHITLAGNIV